MSVAKFVYPKFVRIQLRTDQTLQRCHPHRLDYRFLTDITVIVIGYGGKFTNVSIQAISSSLGSSQGDRKGLYTFHAERS